MKNVKYYLETLDKEKLIDGYYDLVKNNIFEVQQTHIKIQDYEKNYKKRISDFLTKLINTEIIKRDNVGIIFAYGEYKMDYFSPSISVGLTYKDELTKKKCKADNFDYEFLSNSIVLGLLVSDAPFTQKHIYDVIIDVLYTISLYGFDEEDKLKRMEQANKTFESITSKILPYSKELDIEIEDEMENQLSEKMLNAVMECNKYLYERELKYLF